MTTVAEPATGAPTSARPTEDVAVEIVVPVFNEEVDLAPSIRRLDAYLDAHFPFRAIITIADNASTDGTWGVATALASEVPRVRAVHLDAKGRGRALQYVWAASEARVVAYMDVDLSTDLNALLPLVAPLLSGHSDVAIGSRLSRSARVVRGPRRELISRSYNLLLRTTLRARFTDAQCGFKAMRVECARALLPHVRETSWFFDTELLVLAERSGLRIAEVPVDWVDDPDSRVDIVSTALADLRGVARLGRSMLRGDVAVRELRTQLGHGSAVPESLLRQVIRFGAVGIASTFAYLALFLLWRVPLGAQAANLCALLVTAVANTAVNRRFTFGVSGRGVVRHQAQGLIVFALGLGLTSGSLAVLSAVTAHPPRLVEVSVLIAANLASTVLRFVLLRDWVFARLASGAASDEWRDIPHHPGDFAPLARTGRERIALAALLLGTAVLYLWGLGAAGYANDFYAAAVQAGTKSWKAFFFGSLDSGNIITVDKPPAALWPMELSARIFGFSSWSMLVPQAIMGVLSVWLLYATVRRWFGPSAGLLAGALLAITPVAVLMFRFNNPDALMTLLIVLAAYCVTRALETASTKWLLFAGAAIGFSFLAKGLQPFTVLPALAVAYLVAAPASLKRRLLQLLGAGVAIVVAAGWWILAVDLTPASARPYIGGSGDNTALGLAFGYNGLSRITGGSGPGGGMSFSGATGIDRLFNSLNGGQISWLLPAALIAIVALAVATGPAARTDRARAAVIMWGGWLLVTGAVLSFATGIIHTYYTVELAPAIAALVAIGAVVLWRRRSELAPRVGLAAGVLVTAWWSRSLLDRSADWYPWVATLVVIAGVLAAVALLVPPVVPPGRARVAGAVGVLVGLVAITGGSAAYALDTAATPHEGTVPSSGPAVTSGAFGGPGGSRAQRGGPPSGQGTLPGRTAGFGPPTGGSGVAPPTNSPGGMGAASVSTALVTILENADTTWSAATVGSQSAAPLELRSGTAVIAIGGFSGSDDAPTLAQFRQLVAEGKVRYFIGGGAGGGFAGGGSAGGQGSASTISTWVAAHFTATTVGGSTVYDLSKETS